MTTLLEIRHQDKLLGNLVTVGCVISTIDYAAQNAESSYVAGSFR